MLLVLDLRRIYNYLLLVSGCWWKVNSLTEVRIFGASDVAWLHDRFASKLCDLLRTECCPYVIAVETFENWNWAGEIRFFLTEYNYWQQSTEEREVVTVKCFQYSIAGLRRQLTTERIVADSIITCKGEIVQSSADGWDACNRALHPGRSGERSLKSEVGKSLKHHCQCHDVSRSKIRSEAEKLISDYQFDLCLLPVCAVLVFNPLLQSLCNLLSFRETNIFQFGTNCSVHDKFKTSVETERSFYVWLRSDYFKLPSGIMWISTLLGFFVSSFSRWEFWPIVIHLPELS